MGQRFRWRRFGLMVVAIALLCWGVSWGQGSAGWAQTPDLDRLIRQSDRQFFDRQYDTAEAGYRRALDQLQGLDDGNDQVRSARRSVLHNLGRLYLLTQRYPAAIAALEQVAQGRQQPVYAIANLHTNLALAYFYTDRYDDAAALLEQVLDQWDDLRAQDDLGDFDRVTLFEQQAHSYELLQRVRVAQGRIEAALAVAERSRARALVTQLTRADGRDRPLSVAAMQAIARRYNTTLVEYSVVGDGRRVLGNEVAVETELFAWVIPPQGPIRFRSVPLTQFWTGLRSAPATAPSPLETLVAETRQALGITSRGLGIVPTERRVTDEQPASNPLPLRSLHAMLIEPIADWLPTDPHALVTLIPQGPLFLVPFAALPNADGEPLMVRHTLALAPSIQALDLTAQADDRRQGDGLIVGNPVSMPTLPPDEDSPPPLLPPLPGAEQEAAAIAQLLNVSPLLRQQATETAVVAQLPTQSIIHLATHGLLNLDSRLTEFGLPVAADAPTAIDANVIVNPGAVIVGDNVFVGGNDAAVSLARERVVRVSAPGVLALAPDSRNDGWLTAAEIAALDLQADLVVLSACDTGRGRITGDGVVGLTRAFLTAGADTVVVSLWQVPDAATATLMVAFYDALAQGSSKAAALRQAMITTRSQYPDPRNWSAFVLVGAAV